MKKILIGIIILAVLAFVGCYLVTKNINSNNKSVKTQSNIQNSDATQGSDNNQNTIQVKSVKSSNTLKNISNTQSNLNNNNSGMQNINNTNSINTQNSTISKTVVSPKNNDNNSSINAGEQLTQAQYANLYQKLVDKYTPYGIPGPYLVGNANLSYEYNGIKYYYMYTGLVQAWAMGGIPTLSNSISTSKLGYVSLDGKKIKDIGSKEIVNQFNNLSNQEKIHQLQQIADEYISPVIPTEGLNSNIQKFKVDLNSYIVDNGENLYLVTFNRPQAIQEGFSNMQVQMYVGGDGFVNISLENFAKVVASKEIYESWKSTIQGVKNGTIKL